MKNNFPDIETLMRLAKDQPEELERIRQDEVETLIGSAPSHIQRRLRGLQFQIDCKRDLHTNGMGACMAITEMMFDSLQQLNEVLHGQPRRSRGDTSHASVLSFPANTAKEA